MGGWRANFEIEASKIPRASLMIAVSHAPLIVSTGMIQAPGATAVKWLKGAEGGSAVGKSRKRGSCLPAFRALMTDAKAKCLPRWRMGDSLNVSGQGGRHWERPQADVCLVAWLLMTWRYGRDAWSTNKTR